MAIRLLYLGIGFYAYLLSQMTMLLLILFTGNLHADLGMDRAANAPFCRALVTNLGLILLFSFQHSLMARSGFKQRFRRWIPRPLERSFFCLMASVSLMLLIVFWEPLPGYIWQVNSYGGQCVFYFFFFVGWLIMFTATFLMNHWDLFGLRQVYLHWKKRPYTALIYRNPFLYKKLRHPLYLGFLIAFWFSPSMSVTHFFFALLMTVYILVGIRLEEKDLIRDFGEIYLEYKKNVPKLLPWRLP